MRDYHEKLEGSWGDRGKQAIVEGLIVDRNNMLVLVIQCGRKITKKNYFKVVLNVYVTFYHKVINYITHYSHISILRIV